MSEYAEEIKVEQHEFKYSAAPTMISTDGLGPCVGAAIAWSEGALVLHCVGAQHEEDSLVRPFLERAAELIPDDIVPRIHPIVCGGSIDRSMTRDEEAHVNASRSRLLELIAEFGFGKPKKKWAKHNDTQGLIVDFAQGKVRVENFDGDTIAYWPILDVRRPSKR